MARPKLDPHAPSTPDRILVAGAALFAEQGFAARLSDIGARAGIRRPSLLYHFPTKEALYAAVVTRTFTQLGAELLRAQAAAGSFPERLEVLVRSFTRFFERDPGAAKLVVHELIAPEGPGRGILVSQAAPLLDQVEAWISSVGRPHLRAGVEVRPAMLQVSSDVLLRNAAGSLRTPLWGSADEDSAWRLSRFLILVDP